MGSTLAMTDCWVNVMPRGTAHSLHLHPLSVISGTYYVRMPRGAPGLKFEDPRLDRFMGAPPRKADAAVRNRNWIVMPAVAGGVLLFESWLRHEVVANQAARRAHQHQLQLRLKPFRNMTDQCRIRTVSRSPMAQKGSACEQRRDCGGDQAALHYPAATHGIRARLLAKGTGLAHRGLLFEPFQVRGQPLLAKCGSVGAVGENDDEQHAVVVYRGSP